MSKYLLVTCFILGFSLNTLAQSNDSAQVKIIGSTLLDLKLKNRIEEREEAKGVDGYRIQVYFGDDRKEAEKVKAKLQEIFDDYLSYTIIELPYYKVRIGNFRSMVEAQALFFALQHIYPNVFLVKDKIELPAINEPEVPNPKDYEDYKEE